MRCPGDHLSDAGFAVAGGSGVRVRQLADMRCPGDHLSDRGFAVAGGSGVRVRQLADMRRRDDDLADTGRRHPAMVGIGRTVDQLGAASSAIPSRTAR